MEHKRLNILDKASGILLAFAVCVVMVIGYQIMTRGYVTIAGHSMFRVVTGSMEPTISVGALLICDDTEIEDIQVNDIVCFKTNMSVIKGQIVTHRVVEIRENDGVLKLVTKGDANSIEDALYVTSSSLIGRVTWYSGAENIVARVISFMSGQVGFLACIVIPVLLICSLSLHHSMSSIQKELAYLQKIELENERKKQLKAIQKEEIRESDEELKARLRAEIRKELGLDDETRQ